LVAVSKLLVEIEGDMWMTVTRMVRQHPIAAFLAWFFPVGWAIAFIPYVVKLSRGVELPLEWFIVASTLLGLLVPTLAITRIADGSQGSAALWERIRHVRVHAGWYGLGLLAVPAISLALTIAVYGLPDASASTWLDAVAAGFLLQTVVGFASTNLWEEVAWMGFVQARLQERYNVIVAAVITSALFTLQHVPLFVMQGSSVVILILFFVLAIPFRALMAWVYNRTSSLFLNGLIHAAGDAVVAGSITGVGLLPRLYAGDDVGLFGIAANVIIGVAVVAITRGRIGFQSSAPHAEAPVVRPLSA
jgi:uncharacterized protein